MKVVIGSYRGVELVHRALESLRKNASGITDIAIVDDSGDNGTTEALRDELYTFATQYGLPNKVRLNPRVVALEKRGYQIAMQAVAHVAQEQAAGGRAAPRFLFWEEDFILTSPVDLDAMEAILLDHPELAQLALLRGPHFPIEKRYGGLLPALERRLGKQVVKLRQEETGSALYPSMWVQRGTFTCNPSVWQEGISRLGWPRGAGSENRQRERLRLKGYEFAFLTEERVEHDGVRSGSGY